MWRNTGDAAVCDVNINRGLTPRTHIGDEQLNRFPFRMYEVVIGRTGFFQMFHAGPQEESAIYADSSAVAAFPALAMWVMDFQTSNKMTMDPTKPR